MAAPLHRDYFFQVLKNAIMADGIKAAITGDMAMVLELITKVTSYEEDNGTSHLLDAKNGLGYNMLHYSVVHKNLPMVELLLNSKADCDCHTDDNGLYTPLHLAVMYYDVFLDPLDISVSSKLLNNPTHLKIIELLLEQGADVNAQNAAGDTALILACKNNHLDLIKMLAERKQTNIHVMNQNGDTALHTACAQDLKQAVSVLLACDAVVTLKNNMGHTPVFTACMYGDVEILKLLLRHEQYIVKRLINDCDEDGNSPLMVAVQSTHCSKQVVELLLLLKSNLHIRNTQGNNLLHLFTPQTDPEIGNLIIDQDQSLLHSKNRSRDQPLHIAAANGHKDLVFLFVERGADMAARNSSELTPFMVSIAAKHKEVIRTFLECGCEIYTHGRHGKTVLEWSIENEYTELLEVLAEFHGANQSINLTLLDKDDNTLVHAAAKSPSATCLSAVLPTAYGEVYTSSYNKFGYTPLHIATEHGNIDCVQRLIQSNAFVAAEDSDCNTPLHTACLKGHLKIVKFLMENTRADPEANNGVLGTPLSTAANFGHYEVVKYLLSRDVSTDGGCDKCTLQSTPLMLACKNGHTQVVKVLLDHDVNVSVNNDIGHNCLTEAILNKHKEVVMALVTSRYWQKLMRFCTTDETTPMRLLIKYMPDVAEVVLCQCITEEQHKEGDNESNTITYMFEYLDDFQDPPHHGLLTKLINVFYKPTPAVDTSYLNPIYSEFCDDENADKPWGPTSYTIRNHPLMLMVTHQRTRLLTHPVVGSLLNHKWQSFGAPSFFLNLVFYLIFLALFTSLIFSSPLPNGPVCKVDGCWSQWSEWSCCTAKCDDRIFKRVRTRECNNPRPSLGGYFCDGENIQTAVCADNFTCSEADDNDTYIISATKETEKEKELDVNGTDLDCNICKSVPIDERSRSAKECNDSGLSGQEYHTLEVIDYIILSSSIIQLLLELLQMWRRKLTYFYDLDNIVEISLFVLAIVFSVGHNRSDCFCTTAGIWQVGAVALFLAWIDLLLFLKRLPFTGIPINILLNIVYTFTTLAIIPALLILSFALPFYMLLVRPDKLTPFSTPGRAFVKTLVMTTGEFEFDTLFINTVEGNDDGGQLPTLYFSGAAYFLWIVFIILMPVLFNNLLVGLAVGDTASERARATLIRLGLQVRLALEVEDSTPVLRRLCKKITKTYTSVASGRFSFVMKNRYNWQKKLISGLKDDKELQAILNTLQRSTNDPLKELKETVVKQIDELEQEFMDKLQVLENLIQSTKKSISQLQLLPFEASPNNETKEYSFSSRNMSVNIAGQKSVKDALKMSDSEWQACFGQSDALRLPHTITEHLQNED